MKHFGWVVILILLAGCGGSDGSDGGGEQGEVAPGEIYMVFNMGVEFCEKDVELTGIDVTPDRRIARGATYIVSEGDGRFQWKYGCPSPGIVWVPRTRSTSVPFISDKDGDDRFYRIYIEGQFLNYQIN